MAITSPTDFICVVRRWIRLRKFIKIKAWNFSHHIIYAWLKRNRSAITGNFITVIHLMLNPTANFAATFAIGKPVALEANAPMNATPADSFQSPSCGHLARINRKLHVGATRFQPQSHAILQSPHHAYADTPYQSGFAQVQP